jgi:ubiquinone/menaquinone biosynthesis C-methylase UbiE
MKLEQRVFEMTSRVYDWLTGQDLWREQIGRLLLHAPEHSGAPPTYRLLDMGCGPGVSTFALADRLSPESELIGIDFAAQMIKRAKHHHSRDFMEHTNIEFLEADARNLPFQDDSFDLATGHSFLYLIPPQLEVLREVVRLLRPGGRLVLMEPSDTACLGRAAARSIPKWGNFLRRPYATMRFAMSMVGWQTAARISGPMSVERFSRLVDEAGLDFVGCFPSLGGLGMHCVAEKPGESS